MKILVLGNMGYVGPVLAAYLDQAVGGLELYGFDAGYFAHSLVKNATFPERGLKAQYFGDVRRFPGELLEGMDAVVYLAAISNDPMGNLFAQVTREINETSAATIAGMARARGARSFVFASSCSVYGSAGDGMRTEESEVNPLTPYARSKVAAEKALEPLADERFKVTCLRFATACGMSPRLRLDLVLNDFVASAMTTGRIEILSDGTPWRPLIHVKDMARAIHWALERGERPFLSVNTGSNEWNYQIKDLATAVAELLPGTEVSINKDAAPDKRSYRVDFSRFRELAPRFQPAMSLKSTIQDLKEGLERAEFADASFRTSSLIRLNELKRQIGLGLLTGELVPAPNPA